MEQPSQSHEQQPLPLFFFLTIMMTAAMTAAAITTVRMISIVFTATSYTPHSIQI